MYYNCQQVIAPHYDEVRSIPFYNSRVSHTYGEATPEDPIGFADDFFAKPAQIGVIAKISPDGALLDYTDGFTHFGPSSTSIISCSCMLIPALASAITLRKWSMLLSL